MSPRKEDQGPDMSSPKAQPAEPANRGIFDGFESYRTATRKEYVPALKTGLVALDANVLLDLYRYGEQGRHDLIAALRAIGDRLWVSHHAMAEFWRNREGVLKDRGGTVQLVKTVNSSKDSIVKAIEFWGKQRSHPEETVEKLTAEVTTSLDKIKDEVEELSNEETELWARDTSKDEVLQALGEILAGKVGPPLSEEDYAAALTEAKRRGDEQIPPGYLDAKKPEPDSAGDFLVWEQLLLEATRRKLDVLLITRDAKDDWVRREGGEIRGPRRELIDELRLRTGQQFYLRTPAQLLELAQESLAVHVSSESVEDAARISDQIDIVWRKGRELSRDTLNLVDNLNSLQEPRWDVDTATRFLVELSWLDRLAGDATKLAVLTGGTIGHEVLMRLGITPEPLILRQIAAAIEEQAKRMVQEGEAPAEALDMVEPVRRKQPKGNALLVAYKIRKEFLFDLLQAVREPDSHMSSSPAVKVELNNFLKRLISHEWNIEDDA